MQYVLTNASNPVRAFLLNGAWFVHGGFVMLKHDKRQQECAYVPTFL